jgi:hypothetical protein
MSKNDLILKAEMLKPIDNYSTEEVADFMAMMYPKMVTFFASKDINYGGSWQKRGLLGVEANFERKIDRIEAQFYNGTITKETNENIADTLIDNAIYSMMYLFFLSNKLPHVKEEINKFLTQKL